MLLTKPQKKKSSSKSVKLDLHGLEELVDELRTLKEQIESLQTDHDLRDVELCQASADLFREAEANGQFARTIIAHGKEGVLSVNRAERFKQVAMQHEKDLRDALGDELFAQLWEKRNEIKVREGVTIEMLQEALGDKFGAFLDIVPHLAPKKGFLQQRAIMRAGLNEEQNGIIDEIVGKGTGQSGDGIIYKFRVSAKRDLRDA